jgi:hydrogenase expression/formation protein HypC
MAVTHGSDYLTLVDAERWLRPFREGRAGMCLAIPGQIVEFLDETRSYALIDVMGVRRRVNVDLLQDDPPRPGDWVLIHVGFAMSKIGEEQAQDQMRMLAMLGDREAALEEVQGYSLEDGEAKNPS